MSSTIIFPQTAWISSSMGFAGIKNLSNAFNKNGIKFRQNRELQAVMFEIDDNQENFIDIVKEHLPDDFKIPALLEGQCAIISRATVKMCDSDNDEYKALLIDAHLTLILEGDTLLEDISPMTLEDINKLCDDFADSEGLLVPLKSLDITKLFDLISIDDNFKNKLTGTLVDIKSIWFALDYDMLQIGRNTDDSPNSRFKRYIYINSGIVRIRALWEKLIGFAVLLERPNEYDKVLGAKRVRSTFITNFKDSQNPVTKLIWDYIQSLDSFEQRFRTPELHKTGRTIWWATKEKLGEETNRFIAFRNDLNRLLQQIIGIFNI